jgi:hypothetical protein
MLVHLNGLRNFEARLDPTGIELILERPGADDVHKSIHMRPLGRTALLNG